jgi:CubicO group peptidase (beta-lactamase class C family)
MKQYKPILALFGLITSLFFVANAQQKTKPASIYPEATWEMAGDSNHWDKGKLDRLMKFVIDSTQASGMMVIDEGKVLFQYGDLKELSYIASCRKSICAMLYGPFVENGTINLKTTIGQLGIDDIGGLLPIEKTATIDDILTARSGVFHPASNGGDALYLAPKRGTKKPGTFWLYSNWDFNMAGYILEKQTGKCIYTLVDSMLAKPLQMQDWNLSIQKHNPGDSDKSVYPTYHMWFSTEDMARIGYLMLRDGKWKDQQILSQAWVHKITSMVTTHQQAVENKDEYSIFGYGYLWWLWDKPYNTGAFEGAYSAQGSYGNFITVLPKLNLVIALKTKSDYERTTTLESYLKLLNKLASAYHD